MLSLFTGSDAKHSKLAGHVGIITENKGGDISFIHASTSKGVVLNKLSDSYYAQAIFKIVHISYLRYNRFRQNFHLI